MISYESPARRQGGWRLSSYLSPQPRTFPFALAPIRITDCRLQSALASGLKSALQMLGMCGLTKTGFMRRLPALRKSCFRKNVRECGCVRLGHLDSNQDPQLQRLVCCHCTMPQCGQNCITIFLFSVRNDAKFTGFFERDHFGVGGFVAMFFSGLIPEVIGIGWLCFLGRCVF